MSTIETIQHARDIDPDYPACTVLLKGRIVNGMFGPELFTNIWKNVPLNCAHFFVNIAFLWQFSA